MSGQFRWGAVEGGWRKGPWTAQEDKLLIHHIRLRGEGKWNSVSSLTGLKRSGKSCRLRWVNYLRPDLKREKITPEEESIIIELHAKWGNRWSMIARYLPGRTDNEIKNYWRTHFKKAKWPKNLEKGRGVCLLRQQQEQQQQQHGDPQQQQADVIRKIISLLEEEDEYRLASTPPQGVPDLVCYRPYILQSDASAFSDKVSVDQGSWGCLWNLDDMHGAAVVPDACGGGAQQQASFSCYLGGCN